MSVAIPGTVLAALSSAIFLGGLGGPGDELPMSWNGRRCTAAQIPEDFPARAREAVELWKPWAVQAGYRFDFDADARLLLATRRNIGKTDSQLRLAQLAEAWFDELLPASADAAPTGAVLVLKDEKGHAEALGFF